MDQRSDRATADLERYKRLAAEFGEALALAEAERDRLADALATGYRDAMEQGVALRHATAAHRRSEIELQRIRARIKSIEPLIWRMNELIVSMESSRFWRFRNKWFDIKKKLGRHPHGATPRFELPSLTTAALAVDETYNLWLAANMPRATDLERMRAASAVLSYRPTFSILMPTFNTPEQYLREAIESVIAQVYPYWELCIADDASTLEHVRTVLEEYRQREPRIKVTYRQKNGHISRASNTALELAAGEFVALFDHDDVLMPDALYENAVMLNARPDLDFIYSDEDKIDEAGLRREGFFKPDWSPDSLLSRMYTCHFSVYRRSIFQEIGGFRPEFDGSQDYDLVLRYTERTNKIAHITRVLYSWRIHSVSAAGSTGAKPYAAEAGRRAISEALVRRGTPGRVESVTGFPGNFVVRYEITRPGKVAVIVPTRDHGADVDRCLKSLFTLTTYPDYEVVLVDNGSRDPESLATFERWKQSEPSRFRVVRHDAPFNYSEINNVAVRATDAPYLLFLNNDTEIIAGDWMTAMVEQAQRDSIGCIGGKLLYDDNTIQHAGVIIGLHGLAGHGHRLFPGDSPGYFVQLMTVNNYTAVTAACLMIRRTVFDEVGGFEEELSVAFNDVDLCLKVQKAGYNNIYLPQVVLYHYESKSRGLDTTPEKIMRMKREHAFMEARWGIAHFEDPCYNKNLTLNAWDYAPRV